MSIKSETDSELSTFLLGKSAHSVSLFFQLVNELTTFGPIKVETKKTMLGLKGSKNFAWVIYFGKNFIDVVLPFDNKYQDNLCFSSIKLVPGTNTYNHHLRIYSFTDINSEVLNYFKLAYTLTL